MFIQNPYLLTAVISSVVILWLSRWVVGYIRLKLALSNPFPENWIEIINRRLPVYAHMPEDLQEELHNHVRVFLWHKQFIGCAGLEVTEEMRVTIAACACLLLLNRPTLKFKNVRWIYLYPGDFIARHTVEDAAGVTSEQSSVLSGEAWSNGRVILSWDDVVQGVRDFNDGRNVVLHEFAHQLDGESGDTNGAPLLSSKGAYGTWAMVMSREFKALRAHAYFGAPTVLDTYGASSPAEFFAVATESFFEEPDALAAEYPELYEELKKYYQVDPRLWKPLPVLGKAENSGRTEAKGKAQPIEAGQRADSKDETAGLAKNATRKNDEIHREKVINRETERDLGDSAVKAPAVTAGANADPDDRSDSLLNAINEPTVNPPSRKKTKRAVAEEPSASSKTSASSKPSASLKPTAELEPSSELKPSEATKPSAATNQAASLKSFVSPKSPLSSKHPAAPPRKP